MERILAIDDKMDNLISLSALLKNLMPGCSMILAQSGMEGIEKAKIEQPDLILMDIKMPDMDGFETCQRLKNDPTTKHIPVIMVTAIKTDPQNRTKGLDIGADAFISKPIEETELISQVKVALRIKRAEDLLRRQRDALEQTVAERTQMLRKSERKYRSMMESITDQLYICSPDCTIEYMNPAMIRRIGRDATGETCHRALHGLDDRCDFCVFDQVAQGKTIETTVKSPLDGKTYRITNMPIHHQNGTVSKMSIYRDITQYLTAVADKEKVQAQLLQAQRMESIGTLAGGIAHDFNNILTAIIGFADLALDEVDKGSTLSDNLQEIHTAGLRARDLVKQILTISRQSSEEIKPVRVDGILEEVIKFIRSSIPTSIEIRSNIRPTAPIRGNSTQIHQIFMNLFTNAAHAMEREGGILEIGLEDFYFDDRAVLKYPDLTSGTYNRITVSDTGTGIPPNIIHSIFEPYFTTKNLEEGTGLGLALVHGIVASYGGAITVSSELGKGTVFTIFLPVTRSKETHEFPESENLPRGTERLLLIDDELAIVKLNQKILERLGYQVIIQTSSTEALALFTSTPEAFDLVLTDMTMPKITGEKLAQEMMEIRPDLPIILCTGYSKKLVHHPENSPNIKAVLTKPISRSQLAKAVRNLLDEAINQ